MAEPSDPFQPQQGPDLQGVAQEWTDALNDPKVKASLLSFGLQAMQPLGFGQTAAGGFGQAVGAAGEGIGRQEQMDRQQQESDAKVTAASARALADEARSTISRGASETAAAKLELSREKMRIQQLSDLNKQSLMVQDRYQKEAAANATQRLLDPKTPPIGDLRTWARQRGYEHILDAAQGAAQSPSGGPQIDPAGAVPPAPRNPSERTPGQVYNTTNYGPQKWTGTGWVDP